MNVRYIIESTAVAFVDAAIGQLPDRARFAANLIWPPTFFDLVQQSRKGEPGAYRWRCPDPNFAWHYAIDDCGSADTWVDALVLLLKHWGVHHVQWNPEREDHEAWQEAAR